MSGQIAPALPTTLPDYAAIVSVLDLIRKRLLGGYQIPLLPFVTQGLLVFWLGACLGRARANQFAILAQMIAGSYSATVTFAALGLPESFAGREDYILQYLGKVASDGLNHITSDPECLLDVFATSFSPPDIDIRNVAVIKKLRSKNIGLDDAIVRGGNWFLVGLSLGWTQPVLAQRLCGNVWGQRDAEWWGLLKQAGGVGPPENLSTFTLDEAGEQLALSMTAVFTEQHFPHLLQTLGLARQSGS